MAADEDWDVTSLNSVPLSTTSDWEVLSTGDDCVYHSDDELLSLRASPPLARQRSSSVDSGTAAARASPTSGDFDDTASTDSGVVVMPTNVSDAKAEIERLQRELRDAQALLSRAQADLQSTHIEVADAVAASTELKRELDQERERSQQRIVQMEADAKQQQRRINELSQQLNVSLALLPRRTDPPKSKSRSNRKNVVSAAVRARPAKKWFASHNHRSQYATRRAPRGQKVSKRRGNNRY